MDVISDVEEIFMNVTSYHKNIYAKEQNEQSLIYCIHLFDKVIIGKSMLTLYWFEIGDS